MSLIQKVQKVLAERSSETASSFGTRYKGGDDVPSMNTFFRQALIAAPVSTLDERGCLMDDLEEDIWLDYFTNHVAPTVIRFSLV